jgi:hypothetical protein
MTAIRSAFRALHHVVDTFCIAVFGFPVTTVSGSLDLPRLRVFRDVVLGVASTSDAAEALGLIRDLDSTSEEEEDDVEEEDEEDDEGGDEAQEEGTRRKSTAQYACANDAAERCEGMGKVIYYYLSALAPPAGEFCSTIKVAGSECEIPAVPVSGETPERAVLQAVLDNHKRQRPTVLDIFEAALHYSDWDTHPACVEFRNLGFSVRAGRNRLQTVFGNSADEFDAMKRVMVSERRSVYDRAKIKRSYYPTLYLC